MKILAGMINSKSTGILLKSLLEIVQRYAPQDLTMDDLEIFDSSAYEARRSVDLGIQFGRDLWAQGIKPFARFEFYNDGRGHIACDLYYGVFSNGKMLEEKHVFFDHLRDFDEVLHRMLREFRGAKAMLKLKSNLKMVRKLFEKMYGKLNLEASANLTASGDFKKQLNKLVTLGMGKLKSYKNRKWGDSSPVQFNFVDDYESDRVSLASDGNGDIILLIQLEADRHGLHVFSRVRDNSYGKYLLDKEVGVISWDDVQDLDGTLLAVLGDKQKWARTPNMRELQSSISDLSRMASSYSYIQARRLNAKADRVWCDITFVTIPSSFRGDENALLRQKGKTKSLKNDKLTPELVANLVGYREWLMSDEYDNLEELVEDVIKIADGKSKDDEASTFCYVPGSDDTVFIVVDNITPR